MPRGKTYSPAVGDPRRERTGRSPLRLVDRWLLRMAAGPLIGALLVTLTALLLERALRLMAELAESNGRWGYLAELLISLIPHYVGLTLPAAFFLALFLAVARLSDGSEVDALMAGGVSLDRIAAPFLALGCGLAVLSLVLSGWVQPYARYSFRMLLNAAQNEGWNGRLQGGAFAAPSLAAVMTADSADPGGRSLRRVWIRQIVDGSERITTANRAHLRPGADLGHVRLALADGQQVRHDASGRADVLAFKSLEMELPLPAADKTLRPRGEDERELTLDELAGQPPADAGPPQPKRRRHSELYGRVAIALALPLLPLLTIPLSLSAKRGGRAVSLVVAAVVLFGFEHLLQLGESLGAHGKVPPLPAVATPWVVFAALSVWMWRGGRLRPGETPLTRIGRRLAGGMERSQDRRAGAPLLRASA